MERAVLCAGAMAGFMLSLGTAMGLATGSILPSERVRGMDTLSHAATMVAGEMPRLRSDDYPIPCDNPPVQWMCNTTEFCIATNHMRADGCWFMPDYCQVKCFRDIKTLAHTDCVEHPGSSPFLRRIAEEVDDQLR